MTMAAQDSSPLVTVLLPVRNARKTLRAAMCSLLSQTYVSMEILVLDDGSTDGSIEIVESFNDSRLRVIRDGLHKGLAKRLNEGIDLAQGNYIARMDADDISFPERFREQVRYLESHPEVDLLGTRAIVFRSVKDVIGLLPFEANHAEICAHPYRGIPLPHPTWMGRTRWFRQHRYRSPEVLRAEDQELLLRAAPTSQYACLDQVLLGYRQSQFALVKVLLARRHLLVAQLNLFIQRREWFNACCVVALGSVKIAIDLLCVLPGGNRLFFTRMSFPYELGHLQALQAALQVEDGRHG